MPVRMCVAEMWWKQARRRPGSEMQGGGRDERLERDGCMG